MTREKTEAATHAALNQTRVAKRTVPKHSPTQSPAEASARYHLEQAERHLKRALAVWYADPTKEPEDDR